MTTRSTEMPKPLKILVIRSWVRGRSLGVSRRNMPMTAPILCSTWMTNTFSSLPTKIAQPLLVGLNSDSAVRALKGPERPVNGEADRAAVLAALQSVDGVCVFAEPTATRFLSIAQPDVYVKGGDYTLETLNRDERRVVEQAGGKIVIIPLVPGKSTSAMIQGIASLVLHGA